MLIRTRIKFRHLQCFLEIVRQKSLTKAGDALALTQPTVSKTLSELEEELGVILLKRSREGILLTDAGREFYRYAGICVSSLRNGFDAIARGKNPATSILKIGALITVAARVMPDVILRFRENHPDSHIAMMTESSLTLLHKLRHGEIDMIIGRLPERDQAIGFSFEPLYHEPQLFVVRSGHPLLLEKRFSLQNIPDYPFIVTGFQEAIRMDVERFIASQGIPLVEPTIAINNPDFGRTFLAKSDAIWCAPLGVVEQDIIAERLVRLPIDTSDLRATIGITTRTDQPLEDYALAFADTVRAVTRDIESH
jgi:LysR family transcriptional regulator, pca operon transcriptional activator